MSEDSSAATPRGPAGRRGRQRSLDARAAKAESGKWHLLGEEACLNASQASFVRSAHAVADDKRNREWCRYCRERLRQLQLQAEIDRLEAALQQYRAVEDLPGQLSIPELVQLAIDSTSLFELSQEARMEREAARRLLRKLNLLELVDEQAADASFRASIESAAGANHEISVIDEPPTGSGWGQREVTPDGE
jgi:ABC-type uncharacterized transport system ATPase subunit